MYTQKLWYLQTILRVNIESYCPYVEESVLCLKNKTFTANVVYKATLLKRDSVPEVNLVDCNSMNVIDFQSDKTCNRSQRELELRIFKPIQ